MKERIDELEKKEEEEIEKEGKVPEPKRQKSIVFKKQIINDHNTQFSVSELCGLPHGVSYPLQSARPS